MIEPSMWNAFNLVHTRLMEALSPRSICTARTPSYTIQWWDNTRWTYHTPYGQWKHSYPNQSSLSSCSTSHTIHNCQHTAKKATVHVCVWWSSPSVADTSRQFSFKIYLSNVLPPATHRWPWPFIFQPVPVIPFRSRESLTLFLHIRKGQR